MDASRIGWRTVSGSGNLSFSGYAEVTIPMVEYASLQEDKRWRTCIENAGVDNWSGFNWAMKEFYGDDEDE